MSYDAGVLVLRQALCVYKSFSRVSWRSASCPGVTCVGDNAGLFRVARCLCFWRDLDQSAQAEQDTLIL